MVVCPECGSEKYYIIAQREDVEYMYRHLRCFVCGKDFGAKKPKKVFEVWW